MDVQRIKDIQELVTGHIHRLPKDQRAIGGSVISSLAFAFAKTHSHLDLGTLLHRIDSYITDHYEHALHTRIVNTVDTEVAELNSVKSVLLKPLNEDVVREVLRAKYHEHILKDLKGVSPNDEYLEMLSTNVSLRAYMLDIPHPKGAAVPLLTKLEALDAYRITEEKVTLAPEVAEEILDYIVLRIRNITHRQEYIDSYLWLKLHSN